MMATYVLWHLYIYYIVTKFRVGEDNEFTIDGYFIRKLTFYRYNYYVAQEIIKAFQTTNFMLTSFKLARVPDEFQNDQNVNSTISLLNSLTLC